MSTKYPFAESMRALLKRAKGTLEGAPLVANIIPRTGAWTGDNQLGYLAKYGPDQRGRQTILKLDEWGPPDVWTISLYMLNTVEAFDGFDVKALIGFGAGGSTHIVEIDWINGAQISLPMNAVNVQAIFQDIDINTEGAGLSLGVQIARGSRGGVTPPVLTLLENNTGDTVVIPAFAKAIVVVPATTDAGELAEFYSANSHLLLFSGNDVGRHTVAATSGAFPASDGSIRLPVTGQSKVAQFQHVGVGTVPHITMYAEIDG